MSEKQRIETVYTHYQNDPSRQSRYSVFRPEVLNERQNLERAQLALLARHGFSQRMGSARVLDIGAGSGSFGLRALGWGVAPEHLTLNEIFSPRLEQARRNLPSGVRFLEGDAAQLGPEHDGAYDIVTLNTVLSSVLGDAARQALCRRVYALLAPGGVALIYDFTFDNPANPNVRRVTRAQLRSLFPEAALSFRSLTLAPPLSRRVGQIPLIGRALLRLLNLPPLRTHLLTCVCRQAAAPAEKNS